MRFWKVSLPPRVCLGLCLVLSIVGAPSYPGSYQDSPLDFSLLCWFWLLSFGTLDLCPSNYSRTLAPHLLLVLLVWLHLLPFGDPHVWLAICMDPNHLRGELVRLNQAITNLTHIVQELSVRVTNLETARPVSLSRWVLAEPSRPTIECFWPPCRLYQVECGVPEIPQKVLDLVSTLQTSPSRRDFRARRAFRLGFWARSSISCCIPYTTHLESIEEESKIFFVYLTTFGTSYQFRDASTAEKFLAGPSGHRYPAVVQGFPIEEELEIFCIGGHFEVPAVLQWTLTASLSQVRESRLY